MQCDTLCDASTSQTLWKPIRCKTSMLRGFMIDKRAAQGSTIILWQYLAYCNQVGVWPRIDKEKATICLFENESEVTQGTASTSFPVGALTITFHAHILLKNSVPLLMGIDKRDHCKLFYNNLTDQIMHSNTGQFSVVAREEQYLFVRWNSFTQCYYTTAELWRLHRWLGHLHTEKVMNLLRRANISSADEKKQ